MKQFGPFPLDQREAIVLYIEDLAATKVTVRTGLATFDVCVDPDPQREINTQLEAFAGWHGMQMRKAQAPDVLLPSRQATSGRTDGKGFYLDPGRAGISPKAVRRRTRDWTPFSDVD